MEVLDLLAEALNLLAGMEVDFSSLDFLPPPPSQLTEGILLWATSALTIPSGRFCVRSCCPERGVYIMDKTLKPGSTPLPRRQAASSLSRSLTQTTDRHD